MRCKLQINTNNRRSIISTVLCPFMSILNCDINIFLLKIMCFYWEYFFFCNGTNIDWAIYLSHCFHLIYACVIYLKKKTKKNEHQNGRSSSPNKPLSLHAIYSIVRHGGDGSLEEAFLAV